MERRDFLQSSLLTGLATGIPQIQDKLVAPKLQPKIKLSVSSYSYWHFKGDKFPIEKVIDDAAALGLEGIDVLHRQMESEDNAYLQKIKKHA
ncbi:MAG: sugar phosphate isomerase/epimerase, partial [Aquirufa sp.]